MFLSMSNHYQTRAPRRQNGARWTLTDRRANEPTPSPANLPVIIKQSETTTLLKLSERAKATGGL